jgi:hypothetical protein
MNGLSDQQTGAGLRRPVPDHLLLIIANIGTAVVIFPIVRRQSEELALGYVAARLLECAFVLIGIVAVLGIVTLVQAVFPDPARGGPWDRVAIPE